jgi:hypothetical protein
MDATEKPKTSSMDSTFPVELPETNALFFPQEQFENYIRKLLTLGETGNEKAMQQLELNEKDDITLIGTPNSPGLASVDSPTQPFMRALHQQAQSRTLPTPLENDDADSNNRMLTENAGVAYISTKSSLVDLFGELEKVIDGQRLRKLLEAAWREDAKATLKIVWNARSIHLGKGEKDSFYRCLGWMREKHPLTVLCNLQWVFRAVIEKKVKKEQEDDPIMIGMPEGEKEKTADDYDVINGVSHGYWKDLANILVLAAEDHFNPETDSVASVLHKKNHQPKQKPKRVATKTLKGTAAKKSKMTSAFKKAPSEEEKDKPAKTAAGTDADQTKRDKDKKHKMEAERHAEVLKKFNEPFYRALHLTVARLFVEGLREDLKLLESGKRKDLNRISYAGKWAPSLEGFHDKHTLLATSIAEALFPKEKIAQDGDTREMYLKRARETYRQKVISPLRKALQVVERDISANTFENIHYDRVPSVAMDTYKNLFIKKDSERFEKYIDGVAEGKSRISGAVLMPATLVKQARNNNPTSLYQRQSTNNPVKGMLASKMAALESKVVDAQWDTLVNRIKDSGKISSSMAVVDVSGSMSSPTFNDGTCPMDTSIGLGLLLSEITEPPFGGAIITFDSNPRILAVGGMEDTRTFTEKIEHIQRAPWGMSTDFVAVFEKLILPLTVQHKVKPEDMVKQLFVFSDMQFNQCGGTPWETAYERIKRKFEKEGYEIPTLIFWNLAGGRAGYTGYGDEVAPKPVTKDVTGTAIVSGYSAGMMKTFLEGGDIEEDEEVEEEEVSDEDGVVEVKKKEKVKLDPVEKVMRTIGDKAYAMLKVVD